MQGTVWHEKKGEEKNQWKGMKQNCLKYLKTCDLILASVYVREF